MNSKIKKGHFILMAVFILALAWVALFGIKIPFGVYDFTIQGAPDMRFGIDIRGGVDAVFEAANLGRIPTTEELEAARAVIETRLDQKNILDRDVTIDKQNGFVIVRFPWKSDEKDFNPQQAIAELGKMAKLTFRDPSNAVVVDGTHVKTARVSTHPETGEYVVNLEFDSVGAKLFDEGTARLVGQPMSIYMDEMEISSPIVQNRISGGSAYIDKMGGFEQAKELADKISAGSLPFSLTTRNHSAISPTLGFGALDIMVKAGAIAFGIICLFLLVYYRLPGFVACLALLMQVAGQLLALSLPQITLTLPGIAGIILSIGMGVDANIIISERINEEVRLGRPLDSAIGAGFKRAFSSVFDGNITVMIVAIILMALGSGAMLSFAYSLLTGVILNFVAGVFASRLMIRSLSLFKAFQKPALYMKLQFSRLKEARLIPFFQKRFIYFAISAVLLLTGIVAIVVNGVQLDIQFKGGAILKYSFEGELNADRAAEVAGGILNRLVDAQQTRDLVSGQNKLVLNLAGNEGLDAADQEKLDAALKAEFPSVSLNLSEASMVEPFFGQRFLQNGILAIVLASVLIVVYVWISFRKISGLSAGVMALVALLHDLLMVFFACVVFGIPLGDSFIAVALTIIGYSINDTIVIYDRIRENARIDRRMPVDQLVNKSVTQSLSRSVNTNLAVFIAVTLIWAFATGGGIDSIQRFALPMMIGTISGCYSTVCIAGPLWAMWQNRRGKQHKQTKPKLKAAQ